MLASSEEDDVAIGDLSTRLPVPTDVNKVRCTPDTPGVVIIVASKANEVDRTSHAVGIGWGIERVNRHRNARNY